MAADADVDECFAAAVALHSGPTTRSRWPGPGSATASGCAGPVAAPMPGIGCRRGRPVRPAGRPAWVTRTEAELRAIGASSRLAGQPAGVDALTAQELQVALAAARDLSNKQVAAELYLSPKTVEFHLGNVYRKLGIRSRPGWPSGWPASHRRPARA